MKYFKDLTTLFKSKVITYTFLLIVLLCAIFLRRFYKDDGLYYMLIIFVFSYIIQTLLLLKKNYVFYVFRVIMVFLIGIQLYGIYEKSTSPKAYSVWDSRVDNGHTYLSHHRKYGNDTIYNLVYVYDSLMRRVPDPEVIEDLSNENKEHAIFLGCSFTAGEGLDYFSTFPFLFEQLNPKYKSYNYGWVGSGPHKIAYLFNDGSNVINRSSIEEKDGFALYTYMDDHLNRVFGGSSYYTWASWAPGVYIENDSIVIKKLPLGHRLLVKIINNVALLRYLNVELSYPKNEKFFRRYADIINYIAKKYWEINPQGDFYIGIYPYWTTSDALTWTNFLNPKIKVLEMDPPTDFNERFDEYTIKYDGHPSKLLNEYYTNKINELIKQDQEIKMQSQPVQN